MTGRMPVLFVGHGSPMNAIEDNPWSRSFRELGSALPTPRAIVCVSAHWYVPGTFVTGDERPRTIHDFGGFPDELFAMEYPAPGDPLLARDIVALFAKAGHPAATSDTWGLDHGTWSVLHHVRPAADVPVVQVSLDHRLAPGKHLELGRALASLRDEGVLVMGSGNITHDLRDAFQRMRTGDDSTPPWAESFDAAVATAIERHDGDALARLPLTDEGRRAHPTLDHYLPLLHAAGATTPEDTVTFPITGFDYGSLSMRSVIWGQMCPGGN